MQLHACIMTTSTSLVEKLTPTILSASLGNLTFNPKSGRRWRLSHPFLSLLQQLLCCFKMQLSSSEASLKFVGSHSPALFFGAIGLRHRSCTNSEQTYNASSVFSDSLFRFSFGTGQLSRYAQNPQWPAVSFHSAVADPDTGNTYVYGGLTEGRALLSDLYCIDLSSKPDDLKWELIVSHPAPSARALHAAAFGGAGSERGMYMYGGYDEQNQILSDMWFFSFSKQSWKRLCDLCPPGSNSAMALLPLSPRFLLLFGGTSMALSTAFVIDVTSAGSLSLFTLLDLTSSGTPAYLEGFSAGFDSAGNVWMAGGGTQYATNNVNRLRLGCNPGSFSMNVATEGCLSCPLGFFSESPGSIACTACPPETTTSNTSSTSVADCDKCSRALCSNRGSCRIESSTILIPKCDCDFGHTGSQCQTPMIYIVVAICIVALGAVGYTVFRGVKRYRHRYHRMEEDRNLKEQLLMEKGEELAELEEVWRIEPSSIKYIRKVAEGAFGEVWLGEWQYREVAVKRLHQVWAMDELSGAEMRQELIEEANTLRLLRHPNLVFFYGVGEDGDVPFVVIEFCHRGSLHHVLADGEVALSVSQQIKFALDSAQGLGFLHSKGRIHRDIKSFNMLVTSDFIVKVADFGTAKRMSQAVPGEELQGSAASPLMTTNIGSPPWMAPEVLERRPYDLRADVYGFGIMMWEIAARSLPYMEFTHGNAVIVAVLEGHRPALEEVPRSFPAGYIELMQECWAESPEERPVFGEVCTRLAALEREAASGAGGQRGVLGDVRV
eukprot:m.270728 g.270728  ORF g.270728 m.270728 type:complete len:777 (+) comp11084_c0_seq1:3065-5395(+)